jgi:hypothetical protein
MKTEDAEMLAEAISTGCERIATAIEKLAYGIGEDQTLGEQIYHGLVVAARYISGDQG